MIMAIATLAVSATMQPGALVPSATHALVVSACGWASVATVTSVDPSLAVIDQTNFVNLVHYGAGMAYGIQDVQAPINPLWNFSTIVSGSVACATFRAAFGGSDVDGPFQYNIRG